MAGPVSGNRRPEDRRGREEDGAGDHRPGMTIPPISLPSTAGRDVRLADSDAPRTVVYAYPMTGVPGRPLPDGWDMIPGARGCTPEACAFRDPGRDIAELGAGLFGMGPQTTAHQQAMAQLHPPPIEVVREHRLAPTNE